MNSPIRGRRRSLDPPKKLDICHRVAQGDSLEEAADAAGVSLRTVQRARKSDEDFDHDLRLALQATPDPLRIMQSAARAHWRAAAWLLEREDPERYARRSPSSCSPIHFEQALELVVEAALEAAKEQDRSDIFKHVTAACQQAFHCAFPAYGPSDKPKRRSFPPAPLVQDERRKQALDPSRILGELPSAVEQAQRSPEPSTGGKPTPLSPALRRILEKHLPKSAEQVVAARAPSPPCRDAKDAHRERRDHQPNPAPTDDHRQPGDSVTSPAATTNPFCREKCAPRQNTPLVSDPPPARPSTPGSPRFSDDCPATAAPPSRPTPPGSPRRNDDSPAPALHPQ